MGDVRTVVLRVAALAILLLLVLVSAISLRTLRRLPNTVIYLVIERGTSFGLVPAYRRSRARNVEGFVRAAVAALAAGPDEEETARGLASEVPIGVEVREVRIDGRRLFLDLSFEFEIGGGTATMQGRLYQLLYTVTQSGSVDEVALAVDGRLVNAFSAEGIIVDQPWRRPGAPARLRW